MKRILLIIFCFSLLTSCKIFRKSNSDYKYNQQMDSLGKISTEVNLGRVLVVTGNNEIIELNAKGAVKLRINKKGEIEAEADKDADLNIKKSSSSNSLLDKRDSSASTAQETNKQERVNEQSDEEYTYKADPDTWFNMWWVAGIVVLLFLCFRVFIKKGDLASWISRFIKK